MQNRLFESHESPVRVGCQSLESLESVCCFRLASQCKVRVPGTMSRTSGLRVRRHAKRWMSSGHAIGRDHRARSPTASRRMTSPDEPAKSKDIDQMED